MLFDLEEIVQIKKDKHIYVVGKDIPSPVTSFTHLLACCVDSKITMKIAAMGLKEPTPI